jgi:hypothetical protein
MQACTWTANCALAGCSNKCIANLLPMSSFRALEDAAWQRSWYEACPRASQLVRQLGRVAPPAPATTACPLPSELAASAPALAEHAAQWRSIFQAAAEGAALSDDQKYQEFILQAPHEFRVLAAIFSNASTLQQFFAGECGTLPFPPDKAPYLETFWPQGDPGVTQGPSTMCRDKRGLLETHFKCGPYTDGLFPWLVLRGWA